MQARSLRQQFLKARYMVSGFSVDFSKLINHIKYFREVKNEDSPNGKKLGFIAQEMGREINTIGSKANDAHLQKIVVQMKDELEKIKEQLLNIL